MASFTNAYRRALQFARREAERHKIALGRFRKLPESDGSVLGLEWHAFERRNGVGMATVWAPYGDKQIAEAVGNRSLLKEFGGRVFAISIRKPLD